MHYQRWAKYGDPLETKRKLNSGKCSVEGCANTPRSPTSPYCEKHYARLYRNNTLDTKINMDPSTTCLHCGKNLDDNRIGNKFCSVRCSARYYRDKPVEITCPICGKNFVPMNRMVTCSVECHKANDARLFSMYYAKHGRETAYLDRIRRASHKRRAQKFQTREENFCDSSIFERDQWTCAICHEHVDKSIRWPDPYSASLDHIIPLSRGGTHTPDNVQLAHLRCNQKKHTK